MNPSVIFLNGPQDDQKRQLVRELRKKFEEHACIVINRKELLDMMNGYDAVQDESFEWIAAKVVKNIVNNGVFVIFDAFLPSRRMQQYVQQMSGLPCYWIGVFFKEHDAEFYDYTVQIKLREPVANDETVSELAQNEEVNESSQEDGTIEDDTIEEFNETQLQDEAAVVEVVQEAVFIKTPKPIRRAASDIYEYVSSNAPRCFESFKSVEFSARKRMIGRNDKYEEPQHEMRQEKREKPEFANADEKRAYKDKKFRSLKTKFKKDEDGVRRFEKRAERADGEQTEKRGELGERKFGGFKPRFQDRGDRRSSGGRFGKPGGRPGGRSTEGGRGRFQRGGERSRDRDWVKGDTTRGSHTFDRNAWKSDPDLDKKREAFKEFAGSYKEGDAFFKKDFGRADRGSREGGSSEGGFRERRSFGARDGRSGEGRSSRGRSFGGRSGDRRSFGGSSEDGPRERRDGRSSGGSAFGERTRSRSGDESDRRSTGRSDGRPGGRFGSRPTSRFGGGERKDRKDFGPKRDFGEKKFGEKRDFGYKKEFGERKFDEKKEFAQKGFESNSERERKPEAGAKVSKPRATSRANSRSDSSRVIRPRSMSTRSAKPRSTSSRGSKSTSTSSTIEPKTTRAPRAAKTTTSRVSKSATPRTSKSATPKTSKPRAAKSETSTTRAPRAAATKRSTKKEE